MKPSYRTLILKALEEDGADRDITSLAIFNRHSPVREGFIIAKQDLVVSGLEVAQNVFHLVGPKVKFISYCRDGQFVPKGNRIAKISGPVSDMLKAERTALNFLMHLSGIATLTRRFVHEVKGFPCDILDTRKTIPGMRLLAKVAVVHGGGKNHRMSLADQYLIKENHIEVCGGVREAIRRAKKHHKKQIIEVEVTGFSQAMEALEEGVDIILLDNMGMAEIKKTVNAVAGRCHLEVSGGVNLKNVRKIAEIGVDRISIGALTHSAPAADLSFLIK